jgi:hypothetical protein
MFASSEGWQSSQSGGACGRNWAICLPQAKGALIKTLIVYRVSCSPYIPCL